MIFSGIAGPSLASSYCMRLPGTEAKAAGQFRYITGNGKAIFLKVEQNVDEE